MVILQKCEMEKDEITKKTAGIIKKYFPEMIIKFIFLAYG